MAAQTLQDLALRLQQSDKFIVRFRDVLTGHYLKPHDRVNQSYLDQNFDGDISKVVHFYKEKGITGVELKPFFTNGTGLKNGGQSVVIKFNKKPQTIKMHPPSQPQLAMPGYGSKNAAAPFLYDELKDRFYKLETENVELKKSVASLRESNIGYQTDIKLLNKDLELAKNKIKKLKKPKEKSAMGEIVQGLAGSPEGLTSILAAAPALIDSLKGILHKPNIQNTTTKIAVKEDLSEIKNLIIASTKNFPDAVLQKIFVVFEKFSQNDTAFLNEFETLISTPVLEKVE